MLIHTLGPTKWRPPHWPSSGHKSKPKTVCAYTKPLSRRPNIHQSQSSTSALARLPHPRKQDLKCLSGNPWPLSQSCPISVVPLLTLYKTRSCPKSLGESTPLLVGHCTLPICGLSPPEEGRQTHDLLPYFSFVIWHRGVSKRNTHRDQAGNLKKESWCLHQTKWVSFFPHHKKSKGNRKKEASGSKHKDKCSADGWQIFSFSTTKWQVFWDWRVSKETHWATWPSFSRC